MLMTEPISIFGYKSKRKTEGIIKDMSLEAREKIQWSRALAFLADGLNLVSSSLRIISRNLLFLLISDTEHMQVKHHVYKTKTVNLKQKCRSLPDNFQIRYTE